MFIINPAIWEKSTKFSIHACCCCCFFIVPNAILTGKHIIYSISRCVFLDRSSSILFLQLLFKTSENKHRHTNTKRFTNFISLRSLYWCVCAPITLIWVNFPFNLTQTEKNTHVYQRSWLFFFFTSEIWEKNAPSKLLLVISPFLRSNSLRVRTANNLRHNHFRLLYGKNENGSSLTRWSNWCDIFSHLSKFSGCCILQLTLTWSKSAAICHAFSSKCAPRKPQAIIATSKLDNKNSANNLEKWIKFLAANSSD